MKNAIPYILIIVFSLSVIVLVGGGSGIFGKSELDKQEERLQEIIDGKAHYRAFYNNQKRFYDETTVTPERREELREFQKAVAASPERESLEQTLSAYHYWLASLPPTERSNLQKELQQPDATNSERIESIRKVIEGGLNPSPPPIIGPIRSSDDELAKILADSSEEKRHYLLGLPPGDGWQMLFGELEFQKIRAPMRPYGPEPGGGRGGGPGRGPGGGGNPPGPRPDNFPRDEAFPPRIEMPPPKAETTEDRSEKSEE